MAKLFGSRQARERDLEGSERDAQRSLKRKRKILRSGKQSIIPYYCNVFQLCMFVLPILDALTEAIIWIQGKVNMTFPVYLQRACGSGFLIWIFFAAILASVSAVQLYRTAYRGYIEMTYLYADEIPTGEDVSIYKKVSEAEGTGSGEEDEDPELTLYCRPASPNAYERYGGYIKRALIGTVVLGVLNIIVHFL